MSLTEQHNCFAVFYPNQITLRKEGMYNTAYIYFIVNQCMRTVGNMNSTSKMSEFGVRETLGILENFWKFDIHIDQ